MKLVTVSAFAIAIAALPAWAFHAVPVAPAAPNGPQGGLLNFNSGQYTFSQPTSDPNEAQVVATCTTYAHSQQDFENAKYTFANVFNVDCVHQDDGNKYCTAKGVTLDAAAIKAWFVHNRWGRCD